MLLKTLIQNFHILEYGDCNWTRTQNHLVLKRTLNHLAKLEYGLLIKIWSMVGVWFIGVWFTDENLKALETEDKTNITLVINQSARYKNDLLFSLAKRSNIFKRLWIFVFC